MKVNKNQLGFCEDGLKSKLFLITLWIWSVTTLQRLRQLATRGSKHASPSGFGGAEAGKEKRNYRSPGLCQWSIHACPSDSVYSVLEHPRIPALRGKAVKCEHFNLKVAGVPSKFYASKGSRRNKHDTLPTCPQSPKIIFVTCLNQKHLGQGILLK